MMDSLAPVALVVPSMPPQKAEKMNSKDDAPVVYNLCAPQMAMKSLSPSQVKKIIFLTPEILMVLNQILNGVFDLRDTWETRTPKKDPAIKEIFDLEEPNKIDYAA